MKLKTKFLVPITGAVFISIATTVGILYNSASTMLEQGVLNDVTGRVDTLTRTIDSWLGGRKRDVATFTTLHSVVDSLVNVDSEEFRTLVNDDFAHIAENYPIYQSVNTIDLNGDVLASSSPRKGKKDKIADGKKVVNLKERSYFKNALQGKVSISPVIISKATKTPVVCIGAPVKSGGKIIGVVYAVADMKAFSETFIDTVKVGETGYAYLMDETGLLIAHPKKENILKLNLAEKYDFAKAMVKKGEGIEYYDWNGEPKVVAYKRSELTGWIVAAGVDKKEIYESVSAIRSLGITILVVASFITFIIILILVNKVLVGITAITEASIELSRGNTQHVIGYKSDDEIGEMANAFRSMSDNLKAKAGVAESIAEGDLTSIVPIASDVDTLGKSLQRMVDSTSSILGDIQDASHLVDSGSHQVSDLSYSLSAGAQQSAASIEEISSSLTEIESQSSQNAEISKDATTHMTKAHSLVSGGMEQMSSLSEAMDKITASSEQINKIIKVIDDIAFQTNLLALNAAVEAARAGSHGKGFAVVAEEVRSLAGRSAKAASETAELIEGAISDVNSGNSIAKSTSEVFGTIEESVREVSALVEQINIASGEQSLGLTQVTEGFNQIESVTQKNSANSEETAAASRELSALANKLNASLAMFKMNQVKTQKTFGSDKHFAQLPE